jgi:glutaryl-CoA dehydrogenase (non-decarboxylating)
MDFNLTEEQEMLRETIRKFCKKELTKEKVRWMDENCDFMPGSLEGLADLGVPGLAIPEVRRTGARSSRSDDCHRAATVSVAVALGVGATMGFGAAPLAIWGPRNRRLSISRIGRRGNGPGPLPNRQAAPIFRSISTKAEDKGDHWLINGVKVSSQVPTCVTT